MSVPPDRLCFVTKPASEHAPTPERLREVLAENPVLMEVMVRAKRMKLPGWYLTAGCVFQTVWNVLTGRDPTAEIKDYDLVYFDASDLSWAAEDAVIRAGAAEFADLPAEVEIRNEARVHLWYETKFGVPCPPYTRTEDAIDSFPAIATCVGIRELAGGSWQVYAPYGLDDMFALVVRPNPVLAPRSAYEAKTERWQRAWPELTVHPWPIREVRQP